MFNIDIYNEISQKIQSINPASKTLVVGNSADLSLFKASTKDKNLFVSIGNLRWQKNYITLIEAFKMVCEINPKALLLIYGEGPEREILENKIKELNLEKNIILKGYCKHEEIAKTLSISYLYIQSSVSEGLPKSILEGISAGCPIVATNVGSCKEFADKFGLCVEPQRPKELYKAMKRLTINKDLWNKYHKECLKNRDYFCWERLVNKVNLFYKIINKNFNINLKKY